MTIAQNLQAKCLPFFTLARELANMVEVVDIQETEKTEIFTFEDGSKVELIFASNSVNYNLI